MPTFDFTSPDGKSYSVQGPDGATPEQAFQILQTQIAAAPAALPAGVDAGDARFQPGANTAEKALEGIPVLGAFVPQAGAAISAAAQPLTGVGSDGATFGERFANNLKQEKAASETVDKNQPVLSSVARMTGGSIAMAPVMAAAPAAFGLTGTLPQMVARGATSGAAISAADAVARGENPVDASVTGGIIGGAAGPVGKGIGKVVAAIADRVRPPVTVPKNIESVAGVDVPLSQAEVTQNPALSAEQQIVLRGGRGDAAQTEAQRFRDLQDQRVSEARGNIAAGLDPTGSAATTSPQDAAERIASELIAQEQAARAADAGVNSGPMSPAQQGADMSRHFGGGRAPTSAVDAGESLSNSLATARDAAKANYRGKYNAVAEQPGEFAPGSAAGFRNDIENGLRASENPVSLDPTNTPKSLQALRIIDDNLNLSGPGLPKASAADLGGEHAQTVSDIRAKYGDSVAEAYDRQKQAAATPPSLLQFIASKGGLHPDPELEAIGLALGHRAQIPGRAGFFNVVGRSGSHLDRMREAAEEAGYLRGQHGQTSTVGDLLDAIDAEMRGQKRFPEGFEGTKTNRERVAMSEREQHEQDAHLRGFESDLADAGHGQLGPEVKARAVHLMANEGMAPDTAVEHALAQLEQEDAAGLGHASGSFPGDRPQSAPAQVTPKAPAAAQAPGNAFTMRDVEQVRKQISTLYGDARRAMMSGGSGADLHALEHISDHFDARVRQMVADGHFSGDGPAVLKMQEDARAAFADYKQKFAKRGAGDTVGAAVEKILGKFSDAKATPDAIVTMAYGSPASPGGQMPVQIAQRIEKIFGRNSDEFSAYKQGLFSHLTEGEPAKVAARIDEFLTGTKGKLLSQVAFDASERSQLANYADRLRGTVPKGNEPGAVAAAIRRYTGADGAAPASANQIVNDLYGASGKGAGRISVPLAARLKQTLSPESWNALRQGMFEKLTNAGEGKIPFEAQALSQRLHEFLNEGGSQLAKVLYSPKELELMQKLASVYKQMIPVKGTTNPSGTAPMLAKMAGGFRHALLPLLGFSHGGGIPGAVVGYALDKGVTAIGNSNNARKATELFFGPQARRQADPRFALATGLRGQAAIVQANQPRRRSE